MDAPVAAEKKALKARAHALHPILQIGEKGLTDAVIAEIDRALAAHELIKVRAAPLNRDERAVALASICERTNAQPVQHIGKMLVVFRRKPEPPPAEARPARKPARRSQAERDAPRPARRRAARAPSPIRRRRR